MVHVGLSTPLLALRDAVQTQAWTAMKWWWNVQVEKLIRAKERALVVMLLGYVRKPYPNWWNGNRC